MNKWNKQPGIWVYLLSLLGFKTENDLGQFDTSIFLCVLRSAVYYHKNEGKNMQPKET